MTPAQKASLVAVVRYLIEHERKHYFEHLAALGIEPAATDPYALKSLPEFEHVFRHALALKPLTGKGAA